MFIFIQPTKHIYYRYNAQYEYQKFLVECINKFLDEELKNNNISFEEFIAQKNKNYQTLFDFLQKK